jgi:hypothetical protein
MKKMNALNLAALLATLAACAPEEEPAPTGSLQTLHQEVSECGGFEAEVEYDSGGDYCDAQTLHWTYDPAAGTLELSDDRVVLNCCGDHSVAIAEEDGVYVVTETDAPQDGMGRCDCMCVFDFALSAEGVPAGSIALRLVLDETDSGGPRTTFEGELDLSAGAGEVVVSDEDAGPWCNPE